MKGYAISHITDGVFKKNVKYPIQSISNGMINVKVGCALLAVDSSDTDFTFIIHNDDEYYHPDCPFLIIYSDSCDQSQVVECSEEETLLELMVDIKRSGGRVFKAIEIDSCRDIYSGASTMNKRGNK